MSSVLRRTGLPALIGFYRHLAFDLPRLTTAGALLAVGGIAAIRVYHLVVGYAPTALMGSYFALSAAAAVVAAGCMVVKQVRVVGLGWMLGGLVSVATIIGYVLSRTVGGAGLPQLVGWWNYPVGTLLLVLAAAFLALHVSVLTGVNVAFPTRREWHD